MKKTKIISLFVLLLFILTSCNSEIEDMENFVKTPKLNKISLEGSWKVTKKTSTNSSDKEEVNKIDNIYIDDQLVEVGLKYSLTPKFESQYVNTSSYLKSKGSDKKPTDITKNEYVEVVIITGPSRFSFEILKISDKELYMEADGFQYLLEKESDKVPKEILKKYDDERENEKDLEAYDGKIGVSLIIKYQQKDEATNTVKSDYDSYYMYYDNTNYKNLSKIYFNENIYMPKLDRNGIYKYSENWDNDKYTGKLVKLDENNISNSDLEKILFESSNPFEINFFSDQYFSISYDDKSTTSRKIYNTFSLDSEKQNPLTVENIDSQNGKKVIVENINKVKEKDFYNTEKNSPIDDYTNIGISRMDGLWRFKTSFVLGENGETIKDINFDLTPQKEIFKNNSLGQYNWADIKKVFPNGEIIDAFTSPESNFLLVNEGDSISFYSFTNLLNPIMTLPKKEGTPSIVMANWIAGSDNDLYKKEFKIDKIY